MNIFKRVSRKPKTKAIFYSHILVVAFLMPSVDINQNNTQALNGEVDITIDTSGFNVNRLKIAGISLCNDLNSVMSEINSTGKLRIRKKSIHKDKGKVVGATRSNEVQVTAKWDHSKGLNQLSVFTRRSFPKAQLKAFINKKIGPPVYETSPEFLKKYGTGQVNYLWNIAMHKHHGRFELSDRHIAINIDSGC